MNSFIRNEKGSFTIEATLVFPSLMFFTIIGVFCCIIFFQMGAASYVAQKAAAQTAYVWDNSHKDLQTGAFSKQYYAGFGEGDGLYWRLFGNNVLGIFGVSDGVFPGGNSLPSRKLSKAENFYDGSINLNLSYDNKLIYSEVEATAKSTLYVPSFVTNLLGSDMVSAKSSHVVTETPELIRTFNFAKYMWTRFGAGNQAQNVAPGKFFGP